MGVSEEPVFEPEVYLDRSVSPSVEIVSQKVCLALGFHVLRLTFYNESHSSLGEKLDAICYQVVC